MIFLITLHGLPAATAQSGISLVTTLPAPITVLLPKNFFANYNCTILDVAKVVIGDNCQFAPNVAVYTAGHPLHPDTRNTLYEYGIEVTIGDNVWIGGLKYCPEGAPAHDSMLRRRIPCPCNIASCLPP